MDRLPLELLVPIWEDALAIEKQGIRSGNRSWILKSLFQSRATIGVGYACYSEEQSLAHFSIQSDTAIRNRLSRIGRPVTLTARDATTTAGSGCSMQEIDLLSAHSDTRCRIPFNTIYRGLLRR